jgi:hypothetical protein
MGKFSTIQRLVNLNADKKRMLTDAPSLRGARHHGP